MDGSAESFLWRSAVGGRKHLVPKPRALICCCHSLHSSSKAFLQMFTLAAGMCSHSGARSLVKSRTGGVAVRAPCRPVRFLHTKLGNHFFMDLALSCWERKWTNTNCWRHAYPFLTLITLVCFLNPRLSPSPKFNCDPPERATHEGFPPGTMPI